ncbi:hypothetical protein CKM354_000145600 [Cercospora kikuchii]|uniref:Uncharacterized protein n=1 Tax=Cercospora kikuchii TaxID=84275 RepID=A0A9P3C7W0_9PEZI|nr:uncharacterized protein CKM354_000145600 [Cercospora kikuchii]GIZ38029.1 hypothetical protein CKM354_000145600 [Cercospora kikuchii]
MATKSTKPALKWSGQEMHAQPESPLFRLPAELREVIYADVLTNDYEDWLCHAHAIHNGLVYILSAMLHSVKGHLPRPTWLQTDTIVSVVGLSAVDSTTVVQVDLPADSGAILNLWNGRLQGAGQYMLSNDRAK